MTGDDADEATGEASQGGSGHHGGIIDRALGLNPDRTFTEAILDPVFGKDGWLTPQSDDSTGEVLAKAAGTIATVPLWGTAAVWGAALDDANDAFGLGALPGTISDGSDQYSPSDGSDQTCPSDG